MKYIIGLVGMLLSALSGAQSPAKALHIGDSVPDITLTNVYNYPSSTIQLSELKGKLVILDFWSSWCGACINLFPHLDSLQRQFQDNIQIILVNTKSRQYKDDARKIEKVLSNVKENTGIAVSLPIVFDCPDLDTYFPCISIPHEVWINSEGKVIAITFPNELTSFNINGLLDGKKIQMRLKKDRFDIDVRKPFFIDGNAGNGDETMYRSLLTRHMDGVAGSTGIRLSDNRIIGLYSVNQTLYSLIKTAYSNEISFADNRVIFEVKNKEKFNISYDDTDAYHYQYCYDLILPPTVDTMLFVYMQQDLKRYFNISVKREKRKKKCLVITGSVSSAIPASDRERSCNLERNTLKKYIRNYSPAEAVNLLNNYSTIPLVNETGSALPISLDLPYDINDITKLIKAFASAGLTLSEKYREIEVIIITDK